MDVGMSGAARLILEGAASDRPFGLCDRLRRPTGTAA
jgi:hypothetical protein